MLPTHLDFPEERSGRPVPRPEGGEDDAVVGLRQAIAWAWNSRQDKLWAVLCDRLERELLAFALAQLGGNQTQVGERLGIAHGTVGKRLQKYGLMEDAEALTP